MTPALVNAKTLVKLIREHFGQGPSYTTLHRLINHPTDPMPVRRNPLTTAIRPSLSHRRFSWPEVQEYLERRSKETA